VQNLSSNRPEFPRSGNLCNFLASSSTVGRLTSDLPPARVGTEAMSAPQPPPGSASLADSQHRQNQP